VKLNPSLLHIRRRSTSCSPL